MIRSEPEWDDAEVAKLLELRLHDTGVCTGCGYHRSLTTDLSNQFKIEVGSCNVCAAMDKWSRIQKADDDKILNGMEKAPPAMKRPGDGRHVSVVFVGTKPPPEEPEGDLAERG